jgi:hypothetical protein
MEQKEWYKSKTTWFGVFHLVALVMLKIFGVDLTDAVGQMAEGLVIAIVAIEGIVILVLRAVTKSRIKPPGGVNMLLMVCLAGVLAMAASGCNGVNMSPEYSSLLDRTAAWSQAVADKAAAGEMTDEQMAEGLQINAVNWKEFVNAKNGVATEGGDR